MQQELEDREKRAGELLFDLLDSNGDGMISRAEWEQATQKAQNVKQARVNATERAKHVQHGFANTRPDHLFDKMDVNKDGVLSRAEFAGWARGHQPEVVQHNQHIGVVPTQRSLVPGVVPGVGPGVEQRLEKHLRERRN